MFEKRASFDFKSSIMGVIAIDANYQIDSTGEGGKTCLLFRFELNLCTYCFVHFKFTYEYMVCLIHRAIV